jgi:hypothetical protein
MLYKRIHTSARIGLTLCGLAWAATAFGQPKITPSKELIGFAIGDDYHMASYTQISTLLKKWDEESDRLKVVSIGTTEEGRPQYMAIISSPANLAKLDYYKEISQKMARARITPDEAQKFAKEGKAVVWIDGGLHATETVNAQSLTEMVYQMASRTDEETMRFLNDVVLLMPVPNPDGVELVANWYMRNADPKQRSLQNLPRLYQKYIGHDNNRDSIMHNMAETINQNKVLFVEWNPQIMHNVHQTGPLGQVVFIPPFRDPFNYDFDPLIPVGIEQVGAAMHARLIAKGMGGSAMRSAAPYSTWFNGGMRTGTYFRNMIGILTEIIGGPTPMQVPVIAEKQLPKSEWPLPIEPQMWHYRQSIDYMVELERAILDYASRNRETLLTNFYLMGRRSIDKGNKDTWTVTPKRIEAMKAMAEKMRKEDPTAYFASVRGAGGRGGGGGERPATPTPAPAGAPGATPAPGTPSSAEDAAFQAMGLPGAPTEGAGGEAVVGRNQSPPIPIEIYQKTLRDPAFRDPRGYIVSTEQDDFPTAVKFINVLLKGGVEVHKATAQFTVAGKTYPAGSYVVKSAQAFRPAVLDSFEPQDHPMDFAYPGGPPTRPYDITGWTVATQMGVKFDRILEAFDGPFAPVGFELQKALETKIIGATNPVGYLISHKENDSFILMNRLLKAKADVFWLKDEVTAESKTLGTGTIWVPAGATAKPVIERGAKELGLTIVGVAKVPNGEKVKLKPIRIGLVDTYGGSMPSGWVRWIFEQYEFSFEQVFPQVLEAGNLKSSFDVIVFPSGIYTEGRGGRGGGRFGNREIPPESIPEEFRSMLGRVTAAKSVPPVRKFVEEGGTVIALGSSATIGEAMGLPIANKLVENDAEGKSKPIPSDKFYIPGSVLSVKFNNKHPIGYGMPNEGYVFFDSSPVFSLKEDATPKPTRLVWFDSKEPLYSGWALGQKYLEGGDMATEGSVGAGKLVLLGLEATFRATPHATFKLFFNSLYYGSATSGEKTDASQ